MRRFLIHYVIIINHREKKISEVFYNQELPKTHDGYLDVEKFCEGELESYIKDHGDEDDLYEIHVPQLHLISISEIPKLITDPNY